MRKFIGQRPSKAFRRARPPLAFGVCAVLFPLACSGTGTNPGQGAAEDGSTPMTAPTTTTTTPNDATAPSNPIPSSDGSAPETSVDDDASMTGTPNPVADASTVDWDGGGFPAGWLYTNGGKIYISNGSSASTQWMGRGVNVDDIYFCGYSNNLQMTSPDKTLESVVKGLMSAWKPNFVRISLGMNSYPTVASWLTNAAQYKTPMTNVINAIAAYPHVHVLVTLRSDKSMIGEDTSSGDAEATGLPSDSSTTPDKTAFPTGTDATYVALVDSFASSGAVMFGLTNEPGGNKLSDQTIAAAMEHAVGVIRAEEDRLKVPHHIVSVQGNSWTSNIGAYAKTPAPITYDNVVYEVHGYPPSKSWYTYPNIPVIIGEYGSLTSGSADAAPGDADASQFYADLESKQIPNLAWDFDSYSNCSPDLLTVNHSDSTLTPTPWGSIVQSYLLAHASP